MCIFLIWNCVFIYLMKTNGSSTLSPENNIERSVYIFRDSDTLMICLEG